MIDRLGQCHYFQWSMIKSQPTPITKEGTSQSNHHWTFFTRLLLHTVTGSILNSYTDLPFFTGHFRLPVVPHFSSEIVEWAKRERAWKSPHAGKGDTRRGERKMRPFLVWGDFHARLRFARSTILEEKWGTTRSPGHLGPFIHLGIKWPDEPIKARGFHYSWIRYQTFAQKNFIERLDGVKKVINICSSRGLSIYGKVTIIKSLIIPKFVYIRTFPRFCHSLRKSLKS